MCEIKFLSARVSTKVIPEMRRRCGLFTAPRGHTVERALISLHGPDQALLDAGYFHHSLTVEEILT